VTKDPSVPVWHSTSVLVTGHTSLAFDPLVPKGIGSPCWVRFGGYTVATVEPTNAVLACDTAEMVIVSVTEEDDELPVCVVVGTELGATYNPVAEIAPHAVPPRAQAICQVTAVFEVPVTMAVNCTFANVKIEGKLGEITTSGPIVALALPVSAGLAAAIAVMVTPAGLGIVAGAVYEPTEEIVPLVEFPPATPFTCQVTLVFTLPTTDAWKVCDAPADTIADAGVTATVTVGNLDPPPEPPQPTSRPSNAAVNIEEPGPFTLCTLVNGNTRRLDTLHQATASRPMPFI
jgi:hypothetical protein